MEGQTVGLLVGMAVEFLVGVAVGNAVSYAEHNNNNSHRLMVSTSTFCITIAQGFNVA